MTVDNPLSGDGSHASDNRILLKYFSGLSENQRRQFALLPGLYSDWNEKINLISRKDIEHLFIHHVLHSLSIAKVVNFIKGTKIVDVGTGGGFPGIPLAILFPEVKFILVDSIGKKINVVKEIAYALQLENVTALKSRAEDIEESFDFVISRAVASINSTCNWTFRLIRPGGRNSIKNGWLFLKGGDLSGEIKESQSQVVIFEIANFFEEDFFLEKRIVYLPFK